MVKDMQGTPAVTDVAELSQRMTDFVMILNMLHRDRRAHARIARLMESEARLYREAWVQSMDASDTAHAEFKVLIDQGVADALATRDADKSKNGEDNHDSGTGVRRQAPLAREHDTDEIYERLDDAQDDRFLMSGQLNSLHRDRCSYARTARLMKSEARLSREAWTQMAALQRQLGLARGPAHPDVLEEAGSSS
nr:hypothetical protein [Tanacetum cinerariifolium]